MIDPLSALSPLAVQLATVTAERDAARADLELFRREVLRAWRKAGPKSSRPTCALCGHRHLSTKHNRRCPDCPCVVRP